MGNWKPLFIGLIILFTLGIGITLIASPFLSLENPNPQSSFTNSFIFNFLVNWINASFIDLIETGYTIFSVELKIPVINIFALFGQGIKDFMINQLIVLTYLPDSVVFAGVILFSLAITLFTIKLFLP